MRVKPAVVFAVAAACAVVLAASRLPADVPADEIHWTITGPTSVTIDWRGGPGAVRYGTTPSLGRVATTVPPDPLPFSSAGPFREARITGLSENTRYYYSIGSAPAHTFRTPPRYGGSDFTFYAEGDIGDARDWKRVGTCQSMIAEGKPDFVLCIGDLTYANTVGQRAVDAHFNDVMVWSLDAAYMPAWGNHEWDIPKKDDLRNYKGRFDLPNPQSSPVDPEVKYAGGGKDWYWFDYGNVRFIAYPEPWAGAWKDWIDHATPIMAQAQKDTSIDFIVTFGHRPAFSSGEHDGEPELAGYMGTLNYRFDKYTLNLNGHSHDYERTYPQHGLTHVTVGTGGSDLEAWKDASCVWRGGCPRPTWSAFRAMHHAVVRFHVEDDRIEATVFCGPAGDKGSNRNDLTCVQGAVLDTFNIWPHNVKPGERYIPDPDEAEDTGH